MEAHAARALWWLIGADLVLVAGAAVAYFTTVSSILLAAVALVPAIPGILEARQARRSEGDVWLDRALSGATGTFTVAAMLVLIPYMATEEGHSLWANQGFAAVSLGLVGLGFLLWNAAAFQALAPVQDVRSGRLYAGFHVLMIIVGVAMAWTGDATSTTLAFRGQEIEAIDLQAAPGVVAAPGIVWAMAFWRARTGN